MEFRRVETRRVYRHVESVSDHGELRKILASLKDYELKFCLNVAKMGDLKDVSVLEIADSAVKIFARKPAKVTLTVQFRDLMTLEVESNIDLRVHESDEGGRWAGIM